MAATVMDFGCCTAAVERRIRHLWGSNGDGWQDDTEPMPRR